MNKQDCVGINNWQEVERRLQAQSQVINEGNTSMIKVNNSLNSFLNALVLNLKDILENQSDISLWFSDIDEPLETTEPYISWENPEEHIGDFLYSKTKGIVYQYTLTGWIKNTDETLLRAMALTNTELAEQDNERKVFTSIPSPPYESGDWWIKDDGSLFICQIGRSDKYNEQDFINSVQYAGAIAEQTGNVLEVLKGTVITTTDNAVTYLDKATGTTSTISGDSIKTGIITSNNYKKNQVGMAINLNQGIIDTKNFKVDEQGNARLYNGAEIITDKGLMTNLQFAGKNMNFNSNGMFGCYWLGTGMISDWILIFAEIPSSFTITSARIEILEHPIYWQNVGVWGSVKDIAIYQISANKKLVLDYQVADDVIYHFAEQVSNVFGTNQNTWSPITPSNTNYNAQKVNSIDIKSLLTNGSSIFAIKSKHTETYNANTEKKQEAQNRCYTNATLNVLGFMNFN